MMKNSWLLYGFLAVMPGSTGCAASAPPVVHEAQPIVPDVPKQKHWLLSRCLKEKTTQKIILDELGSQGLRPVSAQVTALFFKLYPAEAEKYSPELLLPNPLNKVWPRGTCFLVEIDPEAAREVED